VPLGYSLDSINPMARSAYDCALMLGVVAGYDSKDLCSVDMAVPDYTAQCTGSVEGVRIGLPIPYFFDSPELDAETKAAVLAAVKVLEEAGAIVKEVAIPHAKEAKDANQVIMYSESFTYHKQDLATRFDEYGRYTSETLTRGLFLGGSDLVQAQRFRSYFKQAVREVMADLDVLVTPTSIGPAPKRSEMNPGAMLTSPGFTPHWNLTGLPAMAMPCGFSSNGLPLSMQVIGKPFDEPTVFQVGDAYQRLTDWHLQVPSVAVAAGV
jgi:aspartyl-tRNA(Asn)/glutamyl-tRNA(Gln) amidotransferase subunit A